MSISRTQTTTISSSTAGPSRPRPASPADPVTPEEEVLEDEDEEEIIWRAQARVERVRVKKAAVAARRATEEKAARAAAARERGSCRAEEAFGRGSSRQKSKRDFSKRSVCFSEEACGGNPAEDDEQRERKGQDTAGWRRSGRRR
ncbi:MAG: hypothetical protein NXY57DRAFT_1044658 [Lentinula lateritia]|nr:MAG: hypothetical protein NXY57DRAFT_1044658 [Lentinula lateritia]